MNKRQEAQMINLIRAYGEPRFFPQANISFKEKADLWPIDGPRAVPFFTDHQYRVQNLSIVTDNERITSYEFTRDGRRFEFVDPKLITIHE